MPRCIVRLCSSSAASGAKKCGYGDGEAWLLQLKEMPCNRTLWALVIRFIRRFSVVFGHRKAERECTAFSHAIGLHRKGPSAMIEMPLRWR
jgi:hypothetical protein